MQPFSVNVDHCEMRRGSCASMGKRTPDSPAAIWVAVLLGRLAPMPGGPQRLSVVLAPALCSPCAHPQRDQLNGRRNASKEPPNLADIHPTLRKEQILIDPRTAPYAALVLRVALGLLFLAHSGLKLFVYTPAGTAQFFGSLGLPPALGYLTILWELVGAVALILGIWPRVAAIAVIPILVGAIITVHGPAGFFFTNANGGWEFPAFWIVGLIVQALTGDGAYALKPTPFRRIAAVA